MVIHKTTDFVQISFEVAGMDNTSEIVWRNALYIFKENNFHHVQYTDGTKEAIKDHTRIRKPPNMET